MTNRVNLSLCSYWRAGFVLSMLCLALAFAYNSAEMDIKISGWFFDHATRTFESNSFFDFITTWGVLPAQIVAVVAALVLMCSYAFSSCGFLRKGALLCVLPMVFGAGLIVHPLLKDHWGRPRPRQVETFGGTENFRPFYSPNFTLHSHHKSFPCGHCTMGFYFYVLIFLGCRLNRPYIRALGWVLTLFLGISLSLARIAQGGHFFSDTLFTALILWGVTYACDSYIYERKSSEKVLCKV